MSDDERPERSAVDVALRALGHRDRSTHEIDRHLREKGFDEDERVETLATLERTGLLDDGRFAGSRARSLAARGADNAAIRYDLRRAGVAADLVEVALEMLEPETARARRIVERRGPGPKTARYLRGKGFGEDSISVVAAASTDELG